MNLLPPLPSWPGLHPLVVHFPIALLIIAPLLLVAGLLWRAAGRGLLAAAFALMIVGTISAWIAVGSGEAAGERAEDAGGPAVERVLDQHEELAETTRNVFTALTLVFAVMLLAPALTRRTLDAGPTVVLHAAFLAFYGGGLVYLVNTAHQGGRLVHELGVRAALTPGQSGGGMTLGSMSGGESGEESEEEGEPKPGARCDLPRAGAARGPASVAAGGKEQAVARPPGATDAQASAPAAEDAGHEAGEPMRR